jgi:hypothetical protein
MGRFVNEQLPRSVVGIAQHCKIKSSVSVKQAHFCVYKVHTSITARDILEYCWNEMNVAAIDCRRLSASSAKTASFRLVVPMEQGRYVMSAKLWPVGVFCKPWDWNNGAKYSNNGNQQRA